MSLIRLTKVAQPGTPSANKVALYVDTNDRRLKMIDDLGVVTIFAGDDFEKNVLINGGFDFIQRVGVATLTNIISPSATNRVYSADRWAFTVGNTTTPQFEQVDMIAAPETGISARYYGRYKQLTNAAKVALTQVVLARDTAPLRGRVVRFSAKLRYNVGANRVMHLGLISNTGTADAPTAAWISAFNGTGVDPTLGASLALVAPSLAENATVDVTCVDFTLTNTWVRVSATFTVPAAAKNIMPVIYSDATFAANDDLCVTECMVSDGAIVQDWVPLPNSVELLRCQHFYCKTFAIGTLPAGSVLAGAILWGVGVAGAAAGAWGQWKFPVRMNKAPTITLWNPAAANAQVRQLSATAGDCSTSSATSITDSGCQFTTTPGATAVIGSVLGVNATCEAEL